MKVLVTGANGFLGAWLTKRLLAEGYQVTALVRKNSDLSELEGAKPAWAYGDVTDKASLLQAFKNQDAIFHLAGVVSYKPQDQQLLEKVNVFGTENVVSACKELQVPKLIYASSVVAIGASFKPESLTENFEYNVAHLKMGYFDTKHAAEQIVVKAAKAGHVHAVCLNPSTIYGSGDARKGSRKNQVKVARGELKFYTSGGVNVVAVEDVVEGFLLGLKNVKNAERYILSSENLTIKTLFEKIAHFAGQTPPSILMPDWALHTIGFISDHLQPFGVNLGLSRINAHTATLFHWFESTKAQQQLGFKPSPADAAIEKSVRWMHDNGYLK